MKDLRDLQEELTMAFMRYQETLEHPMSSVNDDQLICKYHSNSIFHNRVQSLTCGVMGIVEKHISEQ